MEEDPYTREVRNDRNYKLLLWANGYGVDAYLYSETLEEGVNCEFGLSTITISYFDTSTGAKTDLLFFLEILPPHLFVRYGELGLLEDT